MNGTIARGEHEHVQVFIDHAKGLIAALHLILPRVFSDQCRAPVKILSQVKGKATFGDVALALGWVISEAQRIIVSTKILSEQWICRSPCLWAFSSRRVRKTALQTLHVLPTGAAHSRA